MLILLQLKGVSAQKEMKDRKIRMKNSGQIKAVSKYIREHLDELIDNDTDLKLQTLDLIFSGSKDFAEEFYQLYVEPLLKSGLTLDDSLAMLVEGVLRPN
jgi:hypothetical protein